jgi:hypothetical protein
MKRRIHSKKFKRINFIKIDWRVTWYSVCLWFLVVIISGFVILPWFYLVLPIAIFWLTIFYFKNGKTDLKTGLWVSLFWFLVVGILDFLEIVGPYYSQVSLYFSDFRHLLKYPLILLTPVIYSLVLENVNLKRSRTGPRVKVVLHTGRI